MAPATDLGALEKQYTELRKDFYVAISEFISTHPHLINRIYNLKSFAGPTVSAAAPAGQGLVS